MKIPNYDKKTKNTSKKLNNIFDEDFRLLIAGESGCGKTNTHAYSSKTTCLL